MLPFSFGGNKVRKAAEFYREIKNSDTDVVMTYGSNSSNHCRIIANMAASMGLACHVISPEENRVTAPSRTASPTRLSVLPHSAKTPAAVEMRWVQTPFTVSFHSSVPPKE